MAMERRLRHCVVVVYEAPYEVTSINQHLLRVRQDYDVGKQGREGAKAPAAGRGNVNNLTVNTNQIRGDEVR